jgi:hypothetical protein
MTTYKRKNHSFSQRLAVRHDELRSAAVTSDEQGRVTISVLPYLRFATASDAQRFLRRVVHHATRKETR